MPKRLSRRPTYKKRNFFGFEEKNDFADNSFFVWSEESSEYSSFD